MAAASHHTKNPGSSEDDADKKPRGTGRGWPSARGWKRDRREAGRDAWGRRRRRRIRRRRGRRRRSRWCGGGGGCVYVGAGGVPWGGGFQGGGRGGRGQQGG